MSLLLQAVFSQSEGLEGDGSTETQYTYYPATIADATTGTMVTTVQASDTLLGQTTPTGNYRTYSIQVLAHIYDKAFIC